MDFTGYRFLLITTYLSPWSLSKQVCELGLYVQNFCDIAGILGLLAIVSETVYKSRYPTSLYNSCGRKMAIAVMLSLWVIAFVWCVTFWLVEMQYEGFTCIKGSEQDLPTMFQFFTSAFVLFISFIMVIVQAINLVIAKRRLESLKRHLVAIRNLDFKSYLRDNLLFLEKGHISAQDNTTDIQIRFKIIILNSLYNCLNDNDEIMFLEYSSINEDLKSKHQDENKTASDEFAWIKDIHDLDILFVAFKQYIMMHKCRLTIRQLEIFCKEIKANLEKWKNIEHEQVLHLTDFVDKLLSDVNVFGSNQSDNIQHKKSVATATTLFIILIIVIVCCIPEGFGLSYYLWNNYFISRIFFAELSLPNRARSIFTSIYILIAFGRNIS